MKKLNDLYPGIGTDLIIRNIRNNSLEVEKNDLFVCTIDSNLDRHNCIEEAIRNGACAIVVSRDIHDPRVAVIKVPDTNVEAVKVTIAGDSLVITKDSVESVFGKFTVVYKDLHKGLLGIKQTTAAEKADPKCPVLVSYVKRGEAGVPTNLDWDGCKGTVRILMNK